MGYNAEMIKFRNLTRHYSPTKEASTCLNYS